MPQLVHLPVLRCDPVKAYKGCMVSYKVHSAPIDLLHNKLETIKHNKLEMVLKVISIANIEVLSGTVCTVTYN